MLHTENCVHVSHENTQAFEALLNYLGSSCGFDFTGYKRSSLIRQVQRRMQVAAHVRYDVYTDYLKDHPEELATLFQSIPINVTGFFRDPLVWNHIATAIIPRIIADKSPDELIKVWSAGCASGEEVYSIAILLVEALGIEQFKQRVRIYGTDVDLEAIEQARQGSYSVARIAGVSPAILARYFERTDESYIFRKDLRRPISFIQHNLLQDAPFSQVDLLLCRNTFIYFNIEGQIRALVRFHFGLKDSGLLVLGKTETPTSDTDSVLFTSVNRQHRIFGKLPKSYTPRLLVKAFQQRKQGSECLTTACVVK